MKTENTKHEEKVKKLINELLDGVVSVFKDECNCNVSDTARQLEFSEAKTRKLLITAGVRDNTVYYSSEICQQINALYSQGMNIPEIMKTTGLGNKSVQGYLPYVKVIYRLPELTKEAQRIRTYRMRQRACNEYMNRIKGMTADEEYDYFWNALKRIEGKSFYTKDDTGNKLQYTYIIADDQLKIIKRDVSISKEDILKAYQVTRTEGKKTVSDSPAVAIYLTPILMEMGIRKA